MVSGLEYLHECHYVHGDLKGVDIHIFCLTHCSACFFYQNNILIKDNGEACLGDFGCTMLLDDELLVQFPQMVNVRWNAPELVLTGEVTRQTYSSDVWAFAMVILEVGHINYISFALALKFLFCRYLLNSYHGAK